MLIWLIVLFVLYLIGNRFYELAREYGKSKWLFSILGVGSYFGSIIFISIVQDILVVMLWSDDFSVSRIANSIKFQIGKIIFSLVVCWAFYEFLKMRWKKEKKASIAKEIEDIGKPQE